MLWIRDGARETREKTRKGMRGVGWEAHVTSRDPTLNAGRAPARSGVACPKNAQRQIFDPSLGLCQALPWRQEWSSRNTPKDAKGDERCGLGGPCHIARPDIKRGTRSCAIRRGLSKKRATANICPVPRSLPRPPFAYRMGPAKHAKRRERG